MLHSYIDLVDIVDSYGDFSCTPCRFSVNDRQLHTGAI